MITALTERNRYLSKLNKHVRLGYTNLAGFREVRNELLRKIAGSNYGGVRKTRSRPDNILFDAYSTVAPRLMTGVLKPKITTETYGLSPSASLLELAVDFSLRQQKFSTTMRKVVQDALVGIGCLKTSLMPFDMPYGCRGVLAKPGQIVTTRISLDDLLVDPDSRNEDEYYFLGDRSGLPFEYMKDNPLYDQEAVRMLERRDEVMNQPQDRMSDLSRGDGVTPQQTNEFLNIVEVYEIIIPSERRVLMMPWTESAPSKPLREFQWEGPDEGPYDLLCLVPLADNFMPISQLSILYDVDDAANEAALKMIRRVRNMKHILAYQRHAEEDAENITASEDLETIPVDNPNSIKEMMFNGPEVGEYQHISFLHGISSRLGGNTDTLGGVGPAADTLGQEQMLMANAGVRVRDGRDLVNRCGAAVSKKHAWFLMYVPGFRIPLTRRPNPGVEIPTVYTAEQIEGDFLDFQFDFSCYNELDLEPSERVARQMQWAGETVPIAVQAWTALQGQFPIAEFLRMTGEGLNVKGLNEFLAKLDPKSLETAAMLMQAYQFEGQGQPQGGGPRQGAGKNISGTPKRAGMNSTAQHAYGSRDNKTVTNAKYSHRSQAGMVTPRGV